MNRRNTIQKELCLDAVNALQNHPTADDVYSYISKRYPSVGKATVYRNLSVLCDEGKLKKISVPEGADRYDHICTNHCHLKCVRCGKCFDVDIDPNDIKALHTKINNSEDFILLSHDIVFNGICNNCKNDNNN